MPDYPPSANPNQPNGLVFTPFDNPAGGPINVVAVGDWDGDGVDDFGIGLPNANAPSGNGAGRVIILGSTNYGVQPPAIDLGEAIPPQNPGDPLLQDFFAFSAFGGGAGFGAGVYVAGGDVNGDGRTDLITGASGANGGAGSVYVLFNPGSTAPGTDIPLGALDGINGFEIFGSPGFQSGVHVAAGDVNGDGFADIVTATPGRSGGAGGVSVVYGHDGPFQADLGLDQLDGTNGFNITGFAPGDGAGGSGVAVADINGDGRADIIIGSRFADPNGLANAGEVNVLFGTDAGFPANFDINTLNGTNGFSVVGSFAGQQFSWALASAGDFNGDRFDDFIATAPPTNNFAGGAAVIFGHGGPFDPVINVNALDGTNGFFVNGVLPNDSTGVSVAGGFDTNGDGFDDILIGAPDTDAPGNAFDAGSVFLLFGRPTPPPPDIDLAVLDPNRAIRLDFLAPFARGGFIVGATDVNGNGIADLFTANQGFGDGFIIFDELPSEPVTRDGSEADQRIFGGLFPDTLRGKGGNDVLFGGGNDGVTGDMLEGDDGNDAGILSNSLDTFMGGAGTDTGVILGIDPGGVRNGPFTLNVRDTEVALVPSVADPRFFVPVPNKGAYTLDVVIPNESVIPGNRLEVIATDLGADEGLAIDGSGVTGGGVWVFAGQGVVNHVGGEGSDALLISGNAVAGNTFDGGPGVDSLGYRGDFSGANAVVLQDDSLTDVEALVALSGLENPFGGTIVPGGFDYAFTLSPGNVPNGGQLFVIGTSLGAEETLTVDGSLVTGGRLLLFGGDGNDNLTGGSLADLFYGGLGADTMNGGPGANVYTYLDVLESTPADPDVMIWNNGDGSDMIDVDAIDADTTQDGNQNFQIINSDPFTSTAGQLRFDELSAGSWILEADINGDGIADFFLEVQAPDLSVVNIFG